MEFRFETAYDQKAVTAMAKAFRKTVYKKQVRLGYVFVLIGVMLCILGTLYSIVFSFVLDSETITIWVFIIVFILLILFQDRIKGYIARKRIHPLAAKTTVTFREEAYCSETEFVKSEFKYGNITCLAETEEYFVFVLGKNHGQIYDKKSITGGTLEEFRTFIEGAVGKKIEKI